MVLESEDVEKAAETFTDVFVDILNKHAPLKIIQNRSNYVPYISKEIRNIMKNRDELKVASASSGDQEQYSEYKKKRNEVTTKLKEAKTAYYREKFNENCNSGEMWKMTYQILGKFRSSFPSQMLFGQKLVSKPAEIANEMNRFFINKITELKSNPAATGDDPLKELKKFLKSKAIPENNFKLRELNKAETLKLIKKLKGKKSSGLDWICGYSFKLAANVLEEEVQALINLSIRSGKFFSKWKMTKVLPGFKNKGSKFDAKFYMPISNLS